MDPPAMRAARHRHRSDQPAGAATGSTSSSAAATGATPRGSFSPQYVSTGSTSSSAAAATGSTSSSAAPPLRAAATGAPPHGSFSPQFIGEEPRPVNPLLLLGATKFSLGCPILDRLLSGGLPTASVTEITGESATGKTQLCLQLALLAPLSSSSSSSSLFLCSDLPFPLNRLRLLAMCPKLMDHVFVAPVHTPSHLLSLLSGAEHHLSQPSSFPIHLILIDSIASLFRGADFADSPTNLKRRSELFFKISSKLKELAYKHQCVVVVTNQVVDVFEGKFFHNTIAWSSGRKVSPAFGLTWANCVNTRLFLTKEVGSDGGCIRRHMKVEFAPHLPKRSCQFLIRTYGVFGVEPGQRPLSISEYLGLKEQVVHEPVPRGTSENNDVDMSDDDDYVDPEDDYVDPEDG